VGWFLRSFAIAGAKFVGFYKNRRKLILKINGFL